MLSLPKIPSRSPFLFSALLALCAACGAGDDFGARHDLDADGQEVMQTAQVACPAASLCHPSVGMLVGVDNRNRAYQCTAFLIASDTVMTNSHCIPIDLKAAGSDCHGRIEVLFPAIPPDDSAETVAGDEQVGCTEILKASDIGTDQVTAVSAIRPDYAVFKVDHPVSRAALTLSRAGFQDAASFTFAKVEPTSDSRADGLLTSERCRVVQNSLILPDFHDENYPMVSLADCSAHHGNSGSPLIDDRGAARGIMEITIYRDTIMQRLKEALVDSPAEMAIGTNFSCVTLPGLDSPPNSSPACATSEAPLLRSKNIGTVDGQVANYERQSITDAVDAFQRALLDWQSADARAGRFGWGVDHEITGANAVKLYPKLECVKRDLAWTRVDPDASHLELLGAPYLIASVGLDRYLRANSAQTGSTGLASIDFNSNPAPGPDNFRVSFTRPGDGRISDLTLPLCQ